MFTKLIYQRSLIVISIGTYFLLSILYVGGMRSFPSGDEPHYLVISEALIKYHSLDVMKVYQHKDYLSFYPFTLDPQVARVQGHTVPWHQPGGPILWLIPFLLFGRLGAIWFMGAVSGFVVLNIYRLLLAMEIPRHTAFKVSLALALTSPLCIYAHLNFVEPIGALVYIYILRKFIENDVPISTLALSSILLGLLPWVNVRFIPIEVPLFCILLLRLYQHYHLRNILSYLAYILPITLLTLGLEIFSWTFTGSLNPGTAQMAIQHSKAFAILPFAPFFGLLFDQNDGLLVCFPLSAFLLTGLLLSAKKRHLTYNLAMLFTSVPYLTTICTFTGWHGGWSPPARYVLVLLPAWSFYLACVWQQINGIFMKLLIHIALWWGVLYNLLSLLPLRYGFIDPTAHNYILTFLGNLKFGSINFQLANFWPLVPSPDTQWNAAQTYHLFSIRNVIWITAYLLLTFFLLYQARSNRDKHKE